MMMVQYCRECYKYLCYIGITCLLTEESSEEESSSEDEEEVGLTGKRKKVSSSTQNTPAKKARSENTENGGELRIEHLFAFRLHSVCCNLHYILLSSSVSTLFIGNLSFETDENDLSEFFSSNGCPPESVRIITSQGRSRGYIYCSLLPGPSSVLVFVRVIGMGTPSSHRLKRPRKP